MISVEKAVSMVLATPHNYNPYFDYPMGFVENSSARASFNGKTYLWSHYRL